MPVETVVATAKSQFVIVSAVISGEVGKQFFYKVELKTLTQEKNVVVDSKGAIVNRIL